MGRAWPVIWTNLNPLHPGILCAKFGWNWPSGSGEEDENVKSLQTDTDGQTDGRTDGGRQLYWAFCSGELKNQIAIPPQITFIGNIKILIYLFKIRYQADSLNLYEALKHPKLPITKASLSSPWQSYHGGLPEVYTVLPPAWKYLALLAEELVRDLRRARVWGLVGLFTGELGHFISCSSPLPLPLSNTKREDNCHISQKFSLKKFRW